MRETAEQGKVELNPGKGYALPLKTDVVEFIAEVARTVDALWTACDTPEAFFRELPWDDFEQDPRYGARKWMAYQTTGEGDELRITITIKEGRVRFDFREWYVRH